MRLADGTQIDADVVIVGVGHHAERSASRPTPACESTTASSSTRSCGPRTPTSSRPATSRTRSTRLIGKHIRVEHWANARHQPVAAAKAMLGQDVAYDRVPYFFTDQYDLGMEYAGYVEPDGYDRGASSAATCPGGSSSRSGSAATAGCWPG